MIAEEVAAKDFRYQTQTGKKPTKLFLGSREWLEMEELAKKWADFKITDKSGPQRSEFRGMKIYRVDDESYVGVAG